MVQAFLDQRGKKTVSQVARENGIGTETLRVWVKAHREAHPEVEEPLTISERARLAELERKVRELRLEREFLGKAALSSRGRCNTHDSTQFLGRRGEVKGLSGARVQFRGDFVKI